MWRWFLAAGLIAFLPTLAAAEVVHTYTRVEDPACRSTSRGREPSQITRRCPAPGGLTLSFRADDIFERIFVGRDEANPRGRDIEVGPDERLGPNIEWRLRRESGRERPFAFIVRVIHTSAAGRNVTGGSLVIAKIENGRSCLMATIETHGNPRANEIARETADTLSATFRCGEEPRQVTAAR